MIQIILGFFASNFGEWAIHKYVLHGLGKNPKSFWSFHWHDHHNQARRNDMIDPQYQNSLTKWSPATKEIIALFIGALMLLPLLPFVPFFVGTVWYFMLRYYFVHRVAHTQPDYAKKFLPWHYDHHMGKDQNANWCIQFPMFDYILGTRKISE